MEKKYYKEKDLRIYSYTPKVEGDLKNNVGVKITHLPTGVFVEGEGSYQYRIEKRLLEELNERLKYRSKD